ncbi:NPC intracellular cholesterol transporter 2 a [Araneus ventricosus]|uniref:NPC intracellular cholesterol transporter 2 a n=1 Tax=Araneus ventricosus TaxID=182803 RepID=A0A4Y2GEK6_ARAVE|nr:NPC intracellular cholesterol transporter 2 a [Araneus ventricosus]
MNRLVVCIALFVLAVQVGGTKFTDCGSKSGQVASVVVTDCPDSDDTCILKKGTTKGITINFTSKGASNSAQAVVHGVIAGVPLPFSLKNPDGCKSGISCPIKNQESYTYTNQLPIRRSYPALGVTVRWEIQNDNKDDIVCVEIPCEIR